MRGSCSLCRSRWRRSRSGLTLAFVVALVRLFGPKWAVAIVRFYVWLFRGSPLLVQLFVIFYGLPNVGIVLDPLTAAIIGFSLNVGAYNSEVIRGVIESIPKGQWEAAYSMGMTREQACVARSCRRRRASRCRRCRIRLSRW